MNLKLYGICFKMRGGPDLLDFIQSNIPIPVDIMEQVMNQMSSITPEEMAFAEQLDSDWKKAFNERVPLQMSVEEDGSYDIQCEVPDELLNTIRLLSGLDNEKIVEEYTASHLKDVCGIDAEIISVDAEQVKKTSEMTAPVHGFDLSDLGDVPDGPAFEDVSELADMDIDTDIDLQVSESKEPITKEPVTEDAMNDDYPDIDDDYPDIDDDYIPEDNSYDGDDVPIEEGYPDGEDFPDIGEDAEASEQNVDAADDDTYNKELANIYKDLVANIKERKLDERLDLVIGQQ